MWGFCIYYNTFNNGQLVSPKVRRANGVYGIMCQWRMTMRTHQTVKIWMFIKIYIIPIPPNIPVKSRRQLLLSALKINCIAPSTVMGITNVKIKRWCWHFVTHAIKIPRKYPIKIPVHLAQRGNCLPHIKNDLSGLWWHINATARNFFKFIFRTILHRLMLP